MMTRQIQTVFWPALIAAAACGGPAVRENVDVQQRLQAVVDGAVNKPNSTLPGAIVHYRSPSYSSWSGAAGFGDLPARVSMRPHDRVRGGSLVKPFLAVVTLQLVEEGKLALDQKLSQLVPNIGVEKADAITLEMLLNHRSGIPEWNTSEMRRLVFANPTYQWTPEELIDVSSMFERTFEPGASYSYSNTNYTALGLVLERATGKSWRALVRECVIAPLALADTLLPEPGDTSTGGEYAHGYELVEGEIVDMSFLDPSMAGAAGGHALITTAEDLGLFLDALLAGELFGDPGSLAKMTAMTDAPDESGVPHQYGLGLEAYVLPGGTKVIGHGGGAAGYSTMMFHVVGRDATLVTSANSGDFAGNAIGLFTPAVEAVR